MTPAPLLPESSNNDASLAVRNPAGRTCVFGRQYLSALQVVKCSSKYLGLSTERRLWSMGVYAAVAPCRRQSILKANSDCSPQKRFNLAGLDRNDFFFVWRDLAQREMGVDQQ